MKEYFRNLVESTEKELNKKSMLNEQQLDPPEDPAYASQFGSHLDEEEDVEELARYHALNDDVDATLYRDNPDYRLAFKETLLSPPSDKEDRTPAVGSDPFEDHPDNEQGSYRRRF